MIGGLGDDTYIVNSLKDQVIEAANGGIDTLQTPFVNIDLAGDVFLANFEHVTLTGKLALNATGDDDGNKLIGNAAANRLEGGLGNDTLDGGGGIDVMIGGAGNDIYVVDNIKDVIDEEIGGGSGIDTVSSFVTYKLADNFENLTLLGKANINATGSDGINNVIVGNDGNNLIDGLSGNDTMSGGKGNDTFIVQVVGDKVLENANEGTDTVISNVSFVLGDDIENLTLVEGSGRRRQRHRRRRLQHHYRQFGDNVLLGLAGNDRLTGNAGNDTLDGGDGNDNDTLVGGLGNDIYFIDTLGDNVSEDVGVGIDLVQSKVTHTLGANFENLTLLDDGDLDTAENGSGNGVANIIVGNIEANIIDGFGGADTMAGRQWRRCSTSRHRSRQDCRNRPIQVRASIRFSPQSRSLTYGTMWRTCSSSARRESSSTAIASDNNITGNFGANHLSGAAGDDTLNGGGGNDTLDGRHRPGCVRAGKSDRAGRRCDHRFRCHCHHAAISSISRICWSPVARTFSTKERRP